MSSDDDRAYIQALEAENRRLNALLRERVDDAARHVRSGPELPEDKLRAMELSASMHMKRRGEVGAQTEDLFAGWVCTLVGEVRRLRNKAEAEPPEYSCGDCGRGGTHDGLCDECYERRYGHPRE